MPLSDYGESRIRSRRKIKAKGLELSVREWAKRLGCKTHVIWGRLGAGWDEEKAVTTPPRKIGEGKVYSN